MTRQDDHEWHVALNQYNAPAKDKDFQHWMYEAKSAANEVPRLTLLFRAEREGTLRKVHRQCSYSEPEPVVDNKLTCCLGTVCRECPHLLALDQAKVPAEQIDEIRAWTCVGHILQTKGLGGHIDTSEGFVLTEDDRMFWQKTYASMAGDDSPAQTTGSEDKK